MPTRSLQKEQQRAERSLRRLERFGDSARCAFCGESDPRCIEEHHIYGRANSDETVFVCLNCHRKITDRQESYKELLTHQEKKPKERMAARLYSRADLLELLAERERAEADQVMESVNDE